MLHCALRRNWSYGDLKDRDFAMLFDSCRHGRSRAARLALLTVAALSLLLAGMLTGCAPRGVSSISSSTAHIAASAVASHTLVYVALGASDGAGVGTSDPSHDNWPTVLAGELGRPSHLVNLSTSGTTVSQALKSELPGAIKAQPDVVTIWLAVNDMVDGVSLASYTDQLTTLLRDLRQGTHAHVYVGNVPDLTLLPAARRFVPGFDATAMRKVIAAWNAVIANVCHSQGATLVDLYSGWQELAQHPEYVSADGFHQSTAGAKRLAAIFAAAITRSGG